MLSRLHGRVDWNMVNIKLNELFYSVTPSRACGLKLNTFINWNGSLASRLHGRVDWNLISMIMPIVIAGHAFTGVWIETRFCCDNCPARRHAFTGVWIETNFLALWQLAIKVTPSRACGLKQDSDFAYSILNASRLHGRVDWNKWWLLQSARELCHAFTGVWIETRKISVSLTAAMSRLHGRVDWNTYR